MPQRKPTLTRKSPAPRTTERFFAAPLGDVDAEVAAAIGAEEKRQRRQIELIAPKNYMSHAARQGLASIIAFTSVEGYPGDRRHPGGARSGIVCRDEGTAPARSDLGHLMQGGRGWMRSRAHKRPLPPPAGRSRRPGDAGS